MKIKFILSFLIACIAFPFSVLCLNVGGPIAVNTTYTVSNSPYIVTSTLTINPGVTLTVQSGVEIKFNSGVGLNVYGTLSATSAVFTSNEAVPVNGSWSNVFFGDGTNVAASTLTGCTFNFGSYLYVSNKYTLNLTGSTVTRFSGSPLSISTGATANVNNTTLSASTLNIAISGGVANFSNNSLINNMGTTNSGIVLSGGSLTLNNTNIINCKYPLSINGQSVLNVLGTTSLLQNTSPKININFGSLSSGTFNLPTVDVPYVLTNGFYVYSGASLTIASNNILKFPYGGLTIDGNLSANALEGQAIYFTSYRDDNWGGDSNEDASASSPAQSNWEGIKFNNSSIDSSCVLRRVKIRYANKGVEAIDANPTIDFSEFTINYHGLSMLNAAAPVVTNNSFGSSTLTPIVMSFEANPTFTNNSFSFSDNQYDAIGLYGGTLSANGTLKIRSVTSIPNVTYVLLNNTIVPVGKTLTIEPGIVIKTLPSSGLNFQVGGTLIANGTLANPIVFTSVRDDNYGNPFDTNKDGSATSPAINDFGSFSMLPTSLNSSFIYCKIRYAGGQNGYQGYRYSGASLNFINSFGTVNNCEIKDVRDGINCFQGATPVIQDNQFINLGFPLTLSAAANPSLIGNTLTNVRFRALGLVGVGFNNQDELSLSGTIRQKTFAGFNNITYVLRNHLIIATGTNINIEAGVVIKNDYYGFTVNGGFKTDGTQASPVVFSSIKDDNVGNPGDTNGDGSGSVPVPGEGPGVYFSPSSDDNYCKLLYLKINYGGDSYSKPFQNRTTGVIGIESASPVIEQVILSNLSSADEGIGVYGTGAPLVSNVNIQNGSFFPISMSLLSNPSFNNLVFTSMGYSAILINDDIITSDANLVTRNVAGISNIAYALNKTLTINSGAILSISAGVVIKASSYINVIVNGGFVVNGTSDNKVIFTMIADDSAGGDSNNNGNATTPFVSWNGISFEDPSVDSINKIEYAEIRFAGSSSVGCLQFNNAGAMVNNVAIVFGNTGLGIYGTSNPSFQNITLQNLQSPVRMDMFSNPTFGTITANNIAVMGIHIPATTYSQSGTFPLRNFAGYTNITYVLEGLQTVNGGTSITIPAGMVFKGSNNSLYYAGFRFQVFGRLNVLGTSVNPVVFTSIHDDQYGNPFDIESNGNAIIPTIAPYYVGNGISASINFGDISDDSSNINYGIFRYTNVGINCVSSSPTITNSTFSNNTYGIGISGTAAPIVNSNSFVNLQRTPVTTSILSYPSSSLNNTISGSTWKGIHILNETLSQDVTLPKRSFGGYANIPYLFDGFTVGTTATLTIAPGVVTKWKNGALTVKKALNAKGGLRADSNIVFTSYRDDFYGGDMNSDSTASSPYSYDWGGISFEDESLDPLCKISNSFIRFANIGIRTNNASPDIQKTSFSNFQGDAINLSGSSNPTINFCDFYNTSASFGVNNINQSFVINAENNWWAKNSGPTHSGNPLGTGSKSSNAVDYIPFRNIGPNVPIAGDVSQNGMVQAFDAAQILQFLVGAVSLSNTQQTVGDVSGNQSLSAMDASYILQYAVGLINGFQSEAYNRNLNIAESNFSIAHQAGIKGSEVVVPINLSEVSNLYGSFAKIKFDTTYLELDTLSFENLGINAAYNSPISGTILISTAGTTALNDDVKLANLYFKIKNNAPVGLTIPLVVETYQGNELDLTASAKSGSVKVIGKPLSSNISIQNSMLLSPNPAVNNLVIGISNHSLPNPFIVNVTDNAGKKLIQKSITHTQNNGESITFKLNTTVLAPGMYILSILTDNGLISQKFIIAR